MVDILDGYTISEILYQDEQFVVYRGKRNSDQLNVILKICRLEHPSLNSLTALQHEYQLLKSLNLHHVINVYSLIKHQHQLCLVMEDIDGVSLRHYLTQHSLSITLFFKIAIQLVDALHDLHVQNIIHKDINPSNIIINPKKCIVKLVGFSSSSKLMQENQEYIPPKNIEGTLAYLSPEQTGRMNRTIDYRTDFYALGVTFYEILAGQLPFQTNDAMELIHCHLATIPTFLSKTNKDISPVLAEIVAKLLAKMPEERYATALGLKYDLLECQKQWNANQKIEPFALGKHDIQNRLIFPQKLFGREKQTDLLLAAFESVSQGATELLFISGYSGVGKTSLVKEIYHPVIRQQGYFISGKYDQLQRATPYSAIIEAFQELILRLLMEPEERLALLKETLINVLGNNGQVLVDVIPNIALIIGAQRPLPTVGDIEARNRFMLTFQNFVRVLAKAEHPLVVFLDDLQWVDNASLELLNLLLTNGELHYFLVIGSYRDNEMEANHPLMLLQNKVQKYIPVNQLSLAPLKLKDISQLLSDMLSVPPIKIVPFAQLIFTKTLGNPFFVIEFLKKIYRDKLLLFSDQEWHWNMSELQQLKMTDNVVDLLIARIHQLSGNAQKLLKHSACIGYMFDLETLCTIHEQPLTEIAQSILEASQTSLIIPVEGSDRLLEAIANETVPPQLLGKIIYRFAHDKIQEAAYQLIPKNKQQHLHLQIGRLLLKKNILHESDERLFEILNHFNCSLVLISEQEEKMQIAKYNLWAGNKAKLSSAYQTAKGYFQAGKVLLTDLDLETGHQLAFDLTKELATCCYLTGEIEEAQTMFNQLLQEARSTTAKLEVYKLNCAILTSLNKHEEAVALGLKALASVGVSIPAKPKRWHVLWVILKIKLITCVRQVQDRELLLMESDVHQAIAALLSQLFGSAYFTNQNLFVLLVCSNIQFSLHHGYTDSTAYCFLLYAVAVIHRLNWYEQGMAFVELNRKLKQKHPFSSFEGKNCFSLGVFIDPWRFPIEQALERLKKGHQLTCESGEFLYANYCNQALVFTSLMRGSSLVELGACIQNAKAFIKKTRTDNFSAIIQFIEYMLQCMTTPIFKIEKLIAYEQTILARQNNTEICYFYDEAINLCYQLGYYQEAQQMALQRERYVEYGLGTARMVDGYFYYALALTATYPGTNKRFFLKTLKQIHIRFQRWAKWCPVNYQHRLLLLEAELARIHHNIPLAMQRYSQAITTAENQNALNIIGIANECSGRFYLSLGIPEAARSYFKNAHYAYQHWGGVTKCKLIETHYREWFQNSNPTLISGSTKISSMRASTLLSIDMLSLIKSTLALSEEIQLDKLLQKLLIIVLQNAGAERGILLIKEGEQWCVEAEGSISVQKITLGQIELMENRNDLPLSLLRYVQRTKEPILITSAKDYASLLVEDAYLSQIKPQSVLVIPIIYQGQLQTLLYLENRATRFAFTLEHIHILQVLSAQAAISLQNARLYYLATHDSLTGLANRNLLYQLFNQAAAKAKRNNTIIAILFFDIDNFKQINDCSGHDVGDQILLYFADLLLKNLRQTDLAVRLGGDEFVVMLENNEINQVHPIVSKLLNRIKEPVLIKELEFHIGASIGISVYPNDSSDIAELLRQADIALYHVKSSGKGHFQFWSQQTIK